MTALQGKSHIPLNIIKEIKTGSRDQGTENYRNLCGRVTNWIRWSRCLGAHLAAIFKLLCLERVTLL